jgi:tetratricopeptide (TPR) repeat protein
MFGLAELGMDENSLKVQRACNELSRRLRAGLPSVAEDIFEVEPAIWLDADAALELIYTEFVVREQLGQRPQADDWLARFPRWRAELAQVFEVHALVSDNQTLATGMSGTQRDAASAIACADSAAPKRDKSYFLGGYEILQEIGRGGMGVVYRARQCGLDRIVALKMILPPHGERERARFRTEAEATARLSHPNIVSIYEVGQERDCPFLSMEFVAGQGLDKQLAGFPMAPRTAAELLLTLARAVAFAHDRGIVHRDLKPANILLAKVQSPTCKVENGAERRTLDFGNWTPKITDFGLAKTLQEGQAEIQSVAIVGTPSYMAPEQCSSAGRVGPAADIYSLGAILYETLTGRPPFEGPTALDILELVRSQEAVPPCRLAPKIPRDLETICLKCLAKQPQQRYASAAALAEDLRRFLGGEPILARPVGQIERAGRWCQRNPAIAALAGGIGLALVCGTVTSSLLAVWAVREKNSAAAHALRADNNAIQARGSAQQEQAAREMAEYRFTQAEKAVEQYLDRIENDARLKEADFYDLRKQLLSSAMPFFEDFIQTRPGDAAIEVKRGRAFARLAVLRRQVGEYERAASDFRQSQAIFRKLAVEFPAVPEHRQEQARAHHGLSLLLRYLGKQPEAVAEIRQAVTLQEELIAAFPKNADYRQDLANSHSTLGMLLWFVGSNEEAETEYSRAFALQKPLAAEFPTSPAYRLDLSRSHNNLANVLIALGKRADAAEAMREGMVLLQALAAEFPTVPAYRQNLASSHYNLGILCSALRKEAEAEVEHRQALALRKTLAEEYPTAPIYRLELARSHYILGRLLRESRPVDAEAELREALALRIKLNGEVFGVPEYRADLAGSYAGIGSISRTQGKRAEAIAGYQQAVAIWQPLLEEFPDLHAHRNSMASNMNSLAALLREDGKLEEARRMHELAIEQRLKLMNEAPKNRANATSLRNYYQGLGDTALLQKDHAAAAAAASRMAQARPNVAADSELAARFFGRCVTLARKDPGLPEPERRTLAETYADQAMKHLREAVKNGYQDAAVLSKQGALAPLRDRADFQQLVKDLEAR